MIYKRQSNSDSYVQFRTRVDESILICNRQLSTELKAQFGSKDLVEIVAELILISNMQLNTESEVQFGTKGRVKD